MRPGGQTSLPVLLSRACFLTGIIWGSLLVGLGSLNKQVGHRSAALEERIREGTNRGDTRA